MTSRDPPKFGEIASNVAAFVAGCDLAGYNIAGFDLPLLEAEFRRAGVEFSLEGRRVVDAMRIFHARVPRTLEGAVRLLLREGHRGRAQRRVGHAEFVRGARRPVRTLSGPPAGPR